MESLYAYIPTDRRHAMAQGMAMPELANGAALFADISGFTPLTEALVRALGPKRGAEALPLQLNKIYDALIAEVDRYRGSVLGFSGDAITCWFDDQGQEDESQGAVLRATACAIGIQRTMQQFASIELPGAGTVSMAIKVAVAAGRVRRFLVGDPSIQTIDVLAGDTLQRLAGAEHQAEKGDVLLDAAAVIALGDRVTIKEWREDHDTHDQFAVVGGLNSDVADNPWPELNSAALDNAIVQPWLLPPVYERLKSGMGEFLTELRPATALFMRFGGIDYDHDNQADPKLDAFIRWVQSILTRYGGYMLQLTIGDKGSYLYAAFGAPEAHEDDTVRAVAAALELRTCPLDYIAGLQLGISQGRMRTGSYGGVTRRTYGVLGDEVNMSARLMQNSQVGQVLVSQVAQRLTGESFTWELLPPLRVKGKSQPVTVFRLLEAQERRTIRLQEPKYALPMIGRRDELALIAQRVDHALRGYGQIVGVTAEAGMGKSRLLAEAIRMASQRHVSIYGGECQSYGTNTSYLVWQNIWRGFFGLDPAMPAETQIATLEQQLAALDPALLPRLPLLGAVLNLSIPDTELTASLDAKQRKTSLEALLVDCVRIRAQVTPLLLVLEDCHWLDPLSHDLLEVIGRAIVYMPVLILIAYRPPQVQRLLAPRVTALTHAIEIPLTHLQDTEVEQLIKVKLEQLYGTETGVPPELVKELGVRAQGNPFYIEELLNYLRDRGIDPQQPGAIDQIELPANLHSLILSRIDQLSEDQKILLKVASVIGRLFRAAMLWGVYNQFGDQGRVRDDLDILSNLELTPLDRPDPELAYLFKHILTQEVAYDTLPFATRALLHDQIGQYIERTYIETLGQYTDLLAFHYDHSENLPKRREYLLKAGGSAQANYANTAAIDYYRRVIVILPEEEQGAVLRRLGQVLEVVGEWNEAFERYQGALALAENAGDRLAAAQSRALIGELQRKQSRYVEALHWIEQAQTAFQELNDQAGIAQTFHYLGTLALQQGDYPAAQERYEASLTIRRSLGDLPMVGSLLINLGIVASYRADFNRAFQLFEESLVVRREVGNPLGIAGALANLGMLAIDLEDYPRARTYMAEALTLQRTTGDRWGTAVSLNTLGKALVAQGELDHARQLFAESILINRDLGDRWALAYLLEDIGVLSDRFGAPERALRLAGAAAALRAGINATLSPPEQARLDQDLAPARQVLGNTAEIAWSEGRALNMEQAIELALGD